ncbi:hypothetical protein [Arcobacter arenosus]|uniref:Uncharacterized protein n=1 Tax=Arcobacter arenosus TaxID=2576037 RepID=A0A5R8Y6E4_9BACT|nr:hypothetical protein [Arcobacter arenosus]TLP41072.1 hypothetical protein FDK22_03360 [Arcobacter arenosus]
MIKRKINRYDIEVSDKLRHTYKPFATKIAEIILMEEVGDIQILRTMSDCIIELEKLKEQYQNELIEYKKRYGEI